MISLNEVGLLLKEQSLFESLITAVSPTLLREFIFGCKSIISIPIKVEISPSKPDLQNGSHMISAKK